MKITLQFCHAHRGWITSLHNDAATDQLSPSVAAWRGFAVSCHLKNRKSGYRLKIARRGKPTRYVYIQLKP